jgi:lysozyme family protein
VSEFDRVMAFILQEEGGYVNNPADPGGETNFGISKRAYPQVDIKLLTVDKAKEIYRRDYWLPMGLESQKYGPALVLMDCAVNQGVKRSQSILARVATSSQPFVVAFQAERALHYASLPTFKDFGRGWMRRLMRGTAEAGK